MRYESQVELDAFTAEAARAFDFKFDGKIAFEPPTLPEVPKDFGIGLVVGPSGSGKSLILGEYFGVEVYQEWDDNKAIVSHFKTPQDAVDRLGAVGLNSIPSWMKPYRVLSNGEKFRADVARRLANNVIIDEFTSVVDRPVAKAVSVGLRKMVDRLGLRRVVLGSCHYDIIDWLQPDWVFDTATGKLSLRGSLQRRPNIVLEIRAASTAIWPVFAPHHYLTAKLAKGANCWVAIWEGNLVGFASSIPFPHGHIRAGWREHRTVILPDYQGLGIGVRFSDAVASIHVAEGRRYFSRTAHPRMGWYRDHSSLWKPTSGNHAVARKNTDSMEKCVVNGTSGWKVDSQRVCFSHEYIGAKKC